MALRECCITGFKWEGTPTGKASKLNDNDVYITGDNPDVAILIVHDALGWTFPNARLLADHYAQEINATVYLPDFYDGEVLDPSIFVPGADLSKFDFEGFAHRHRRELREPQIFAAAKTLRQKHKKLGAVGYCWGGWGVFRLAAKEHDPPLVDAISAGHPSWLTHKDIEDVAVPVQVLAPEIDYSLPAELKSFVFETFSKAALEFDYRHFKGMEHGALVRGDERQPGERTAMTRAKNAVVGWLRDFLHDLFSIFSIGDCAIS
ncbi:hypothetical protein M426DRAFT_325957 [Hypoxylon sp. CI-4A]|nr:hypothetical protein M426DRAFT_325957 [Hypoxylon sp. CI-4A]